MTHRLLVKSTLILLIAPSFILSFFVNVEFAYGTIPLSPIKVSLAEFAVIPDSSLDKPPRLHVMTSDSIGRLFVNDQRGPLYLIENGGQDVTEYLDLRNIPGVSLISSTSEVGFQSFAFHPEFGTPGMPGYGRFYTLHSSSFKTPTPDFTPTDTAPNSFHSVLLEWRTNDPYATTFVAELPNEPYRELMRFQQPAGNHNGGLVAFNPTAEPNHPDYGKLYVSMGDGANFDAYNTGQDTSDPFGAILRIDPLGNNSQNGKYGLVAENVLASDEDPNTLGEIYAYGFRNPQRFSWDVATGNLFVADIGQGRWEELNLVVNGGNYGWSVHEGSAQSPGSFINPIAEFGHGDQIPDPPTTIDRHAITVGEVARNTSIPGLDGKIVLSDFPIGLVYLLDVDNDPLDGGSDGLTELRFIDEAGELAHVLDFINESRQKRGLPNAVRADSRFSVNTPGEIYVINKQDGIVRRMVAATLAGDFNGDGIVDAADYTVWRDTLGQTGADLAADGDHNLQVDQQDYVLWKNNFGALAPATLESGTVTVPEPPSGTLLVIPAALLLLAGARYVLSVGRFR